MVVEKRNSQKDVIEHRMVNGNIKNFRVTVKTKKLLAYDRFGNEFDFTTVGHDTDDGKYRYVITRDRINEVEFWLSSLETLFQYKFFTKLTASIVILIIVLVLSYSYLFDSGQDFPQGSKEILLMVIGGAVAKLFGDN